MALDARTKQLIDQKFKTGQALSAPTPEKTAYLNTLKNNSTMAVDPNQYKTQTATINDVSNKYGFDFSREYANRQAEAEAQAKRNANADAQRRNASNRDLNLKSIDNNLMSQAEGLDRNYFQQYQQQQQSQVNGGINGGIAADQDLRMSMARQAAMGDSYRDANLGRMQENQRFSNDDLRLAEDLGLINQSALARAESMYNDRLMQGAGLAQNLDQFNLSQNGMLLDAALQNRSQNIGIDQFNRNYALDQDKFKWTKDTDVRDYKRGVFESDRGYNRGVLESDRGYNRGVLESDRNYGLDVKKFDWSKYMDGQQMSLARQSESRQAADAAARRKAEEAALAGGVAEPYTKDHSYRGAQQYWLGKLDEIKTLGATGYEKKLLSDPAQMQYFYNQGYDLNSTVDALYSIASNGQFRTKADYTTYYDKVVKEANKKQTR